MIFFLAIVHLTWWNLRFFWNTVVKILWNERLWNARPTIVKKLPKFDNMSRRRANYKLLGHWNIGKFHLRLSQNVEWVMSADRKSNFQLLKVHLKSVSINVDETTRRWVREISCVSKNVSIQTSLTGPVAICHTWW